MAVTLEQKIADAEKVLKLAAEMSEYYYHKPLIICYSGGKDSDVMLDIAKSVLIQMSLRLLIPTLRLMHPKLCIIFETYLRRVRRKELKQKFVCRDIRVNRPRCGN